MKKIINWLKTSFEGADGRASSKKLTLAAFVFFTMIMIAGTMLVKYKEPGASQVFPDIAWIMIVTGALGTSATSVYSAVNHHKIDKDKK